MTSRRRARSSSGRNAGSGGRRASAEAGSAKKRTAIKNRQFLKLLAANQGEAAMEREVLLRQVTDQVQRNPAGDVNVSHDVPLVPQPTQVSCWAAALTMVVDYRDQMNYPVQQIASRAGMNLNTGYRWGQIQNAVSTWGLQEIAPMSADPIWWADMLDAHGPLWIVEVGAPYHAVVVTALHGGGTAGDTEVHVNNPWPPNSGVVEYKTFEDFDQEFGLGAGAGAAIVHA